MKKIVTTFCLFLLVQAANAADGINEDVFNACTVIFVMLAIMGFILSLLKKILEHRLKNKIIDKGVPETVASSILQTSTGEKKYANIKWFAILAGLGAGLLAVYYTRPLDIHSLAIMAFSISLSFLGYYFFVKKMGGND
jgi:hypothetical protein